MKRLAEFLVRAADLAEAEGRALLETLRAEGRWLRAYLARLGIALACLIGAILLLAAGFVLLGVAEYQLFLEHMNPAGAAALTGLTMLVLGSISLWIFYRNTKA